MTDVLDICACHSLSWALGTQVWTNIDKTDCSVEFTSGRGTGPGWHAQSLGLKPESTTGRLRAGDSLEIGDHVFVRVSV